MVMRWIERESFKFGLTNTLFFRNAVRRVAYFRAENDPEKVHELALEALNEYLDVIDEVSKDFDFEDLHVDIAGKEVMPFGTAAGLDKNADAVKPLSRLFGYQKPGTFIVPIREGNKRPRVAVDEKTDEIYNAQGFPSKGLDYALEKIIKFREEGEMGLLIPSVCGLPLEENLEKAYQELELILTKINPYTDGIEWNPFSPNTKALAALRNPSEFKRSAKLIKDIVGDKLKIVKMGPYDEGKSLDWLKLVEAFLDGGGDGLTAVNTYMVPKEIVPSKDWGYPSAGRSGTFLQNYRQRALRDARTNFPKAFIFATGGINSGEQAWNALQYADAIEGYTPYTFSGFGLIIEMAKYIQDKLKETRDSNLKDFLKSRKF